MIADINNHTSGVNNAGYYLFCHENQTLYFVATANVTVSQYQYDGTTVSRIMNDAATSQFAQISYKGDAYFFYSDVRKMQNDTAGTITVSSGYSQCYFPTVIGIYQLITSLLHYGGLTDRCLGDYLYFFATQANMWTLQRFNGTHTLAIAPPTGINLGAYGSNNPTPIQAPSSFSGNDVVGYFRVVVE